MVARSSTRVRGGNDKSSSRSGGRRSKAGGASGSQRIYWRRDAEEKAAQAATEELQSRREAAASEDEGGEGPSRRECVGAEAARAKMGQNTSKEGEDQEALAEQCFHRKASFVEAIMALVGLGGGRLTRADSNETLHMESDESDDDSVGRSRRGSGAVAAGVAKASASPHVRRRSSMNTRPSPPYNAPKNADAAISDIKRPSLASIGSGISQRRSSVSELLDVERKEDEEDLELLSHLQTNSEYSDETTETYLTEDQELLLLRRAADAWEKKDISAITDCESEIRVKLLDPKKDSREALENEVMLLRQQLESKNSEMMRLKSSSVSGVSTSELYLIDSMSTTSDNFSESDAFSSVSGAFSSVSGAGYL